MKHLGALFYPLHLGFSLTVHFRCTSFWTAAQGTISGLMVTLGIFLAPPSSILSKANLHHRSRGCSQSEEFLRIFGFSILSINVTHYCTVGRSPRGWIRSANVINSSNVHSLALMNRLWRHDTHIDGFVLCAHVGRWIMRT